jgi:hypothetical protein
MNRKTLLLLGVVIVAVTLWMLFYSNKEGIAARAAVAARPAGGSGSSSAGKGGSGGGGGGKGGGGGGKADCFSGDSIIYLEGNITKHIKDAAIGDKILSYSIRENKFVYSPIVAIPHETNNTISQFVEIQTSNGNKLKLTPDHFIPIMSSKDITFDIISAKDVAVGDTVITVDGRELVSEVSNVDCEGVYTVITLEEFIIVNNIVASPYAIFHFLGNAFYSIHKLLYKANPDIVKHELFSKLNKHTEQFYSKTIGIYNNLVKA